MMADFQPLGGGHETPHRANVSRVQPPAGVIAASISSFVGISLPLGHRGGFLGSAGALRPSSGRSARVIIGAGTLGHAFTPIRIGCAVVARDWGQAVSPWPSLRYPLGNLAAPTSAIRMRRAGGCTSHCGCVLCGFGFLALFCPFASIRHRLGATVEGLCRTCPAVHRSRTSPSRSDRSGVHWPDVARTARRAAAIISPSRPPSNALPRPASHRSGANR